MGMGGGYGHHHPQPPTMFNAYGQPMSAAAAAAASPFMPPHMQAPSMYQQGNGGSSDMLPASVQLRLDQLAATGFCHPGEIDDRFVNYAFASKERFTSNEIGNWKPVVGRCSVDLNSLTSLRLCTALPPVLLDQVLTLLW